MPLYVCKKRYFGSSDLGEGGFVAAGAEIEVDKKIKLPESHFVLKSAEENSDEDGELTPQQKAAKTKADKKAAAEAAKNEE